jgi:hypothetical protein
MGVLAKILAPNHDALESGSAQLDVWLASAPEAVKEVTSRGKEQLR